MPAATRAHVTKKTKPYPASEHDIGCRLSLLQRRQRAFGEGSGGLGARRQRPHSRAMKAAGVSRLSRCAEGKHCCSKRSRSAPLAGEGFHAELIKPDMG